MPTIPNAYGDNKFMQQSEGTDSHTSLLAWVMERVTHARRMRDQRYGERWKEYTRLWRGFYTDKDRNTNSERSKLIAPALQQAVEMTVAEQEEAAFGRTAWFDITDDIRDENRDDALGYRDQLLEDMKVDNVAGEATRAFLLGAIYGTGILKIAARKAYDVSIQDGEKVEVERISVPAWAIRPDQFLIDPSADSIESALFVGDEMLKPLHSIQAKIVAGIYRRVPLSPWTGQRASTDGTDHNSTVRAEDGGVLITEYAGKVPARYIPNAKRPVGGMVEALVTVVNEQYVLKAVENPYIMQDRPYVAYQHDTVIGEFFGRGVCEKGYNPQKALDAELRARVDTLALITAPMVGADLTRLPGKVDTTARPGKTIFTRGRPSEIYETISLGDPSLLAHTFQQSGDLERMVQMGTGAMDSATPVGVNARNETASGISQLQAGFIKRSKRTMQNIDRNLLGPLVQKTLWRYMQFDPARYQQDFRFLVNSTMGIMAKEVENTQLTNMLGFLDKDDAARNIVIQAIFENSASANKKELRAAMEQMARPPSPEEQAKAQELEQIQLETMRATAEKEKAVAEKEAALAQKALADTQLALEKARHERIEADLEDDLVDIQAANAATAAQKTRVQEQQNAVAAERNQIERIKASKTGTSTESK